MNKLVNVSELKAEDEIIISSNSNLKYLKVLSPVQRKQKLNWKGEAVYKNVKCSIRQDSTNRAYRAWKYIFEQDITKHNQIIYLNLNHRDIFLIKRTN